VRLVPEDPADLRYFAPRSRARRDQLSAAYDSEVRYMDRHVGDLVDRMRALGRPLLVCIVGDHGEGLGDHGWWTHGILYQEQIRVPMLLVGPGLPSGRRIDSMVRTVDVAPTLLALLDEDPKEALGDVDGVDLSSLWEEGAGVRGLDLEAYAESVTTGMGYFNPATGSRNRKHDALYVLIRDGWKYIHHVRPDGDPEPNELYDLERDPGERENVAAAEPERVESMFLRLVELDPIFDPARATRGDDLSEADRRRLEALGYAGDSLGRSEDEKDEKDEEGEKDGATSGGDRR
jgi:arylsulfatase A-like enzyme